MSQSPISHLPSSIFLLGFMASGKSTIGRALATHLNMPFIDLDEEIVKYAGQTIGEIVRQAGEAHFRQLETECLQKAAQETAGVIALGGGAFTQASNRALVAQHGISVWLDAPFELCWQRIQSDAVVRPLAPTREEAFARYQQRNPLYQQAQLRIPLTAASSPVSAVAQILNQLRRP